MAERIVLDIGFEPNPSIIAQSFFMAAERIENMMPVLEEAVPIYAAEIESNFEAEGRPAKWAPLAPSTIQDRQPVSNWKRRVLGNISSSKERILDRTGALRETVTSPGSWQISREGTTVIAELGDTTGYGGYHLLGRQSPTFMPIRDWAFVSDEALESVNEILMDYITEPFENLPG